MSYVLNTHHRRCDRDKLIMMFLTTETSCLNGSAAKRKSDIINKISNYPNNSHSFLLFHIFCYLVRYLIDMAI